jgi:signal transduction histidine kinase/CheY-like chemotaxis protein
MRGFSSGAHLFQSADDAVALVKSILAAVGDAVLIVDPLDQIVEANLGAQRLFGYRRSELLGAARKLLLPGPFATSQQSARRRDGSSVNAEASVSTVLIAGQKFTVCVIRDISGQKKAESLARQLQQELELRVRERTADLAKANTSLQQEIAGRKRAQDEIGHHVAQLETAAVQIQQQSLALQAEKERADDANRAKTDFVANMSHELRTPLTAILGYAELLRDRLDDPADRDAAETIRRNGDHLLAIINDILDLSKIESGRLDVECVACSPQQVITDVVSLIRTRAEEKRLTLDLYFDGSIPAYIESDAFRLRQVLINLVGNAIKFTSVGGVRLVTRFTPMPAIGGDSRQRGELQFEIMDTGIGMTREHVERVFEPFNQADASMTRRYGGTGLGLAISRRLADMLGGRLSVESELGIGSTFRLTIAVTCVAGPPTQTSAPSLGALSGSLSGDELKLNCRILLADDGPDNRRLLAYILQRAGAQVTIAEDGQMAMELALAAESDGRPFDIVLMDMQMPILDGYGATELLRSLGYTRPIIALTAHAMKGDREKCLQAGCTDYATKPTDRLRLLSQIARHISQRTGT